MAYRGEYKYLGIIIFNFIALFHIRDSENQYENINSKKFLYYISIFISIFSFIYIIITIIFSAVTKSDRIGGIVLGVGSFTHLLFVNFACSVFVYLVSDNKKLKNIELINFIVTFFSLLFLQQRAAYLGFIVSLFVILLVLNYSNKLSFIKTIIVKNKTIIMLIMLIMIICILVFSLFINLNVIFAKLTDLSGSGRTAIWALLFKVLSDSNIFFGVGGELQNLMFKHKIFYTTHFGNAIYFFVNNSYAHNIFFVHMLRAGVLGFVTMLAFVLYILYYLYKCIKKSVSNFNCLLFSLSAIFSIIAPLVIGNFEENMVINMLNLTNPIFFIYLSYLGDFCAYNDIFNSSK